MNLTRKVIQDKSKPLFLLVILFILGAIFFISLRTSPMISDIYSRILEIPAFIFKPFYLNGTDIQMPNTTDIQMSNATDIQVLNATDIQMLNETDSQMPNTTDIQMSNATDIQMLNATDLKFCYKN
ncbi:DEAD-like helicase [Gigaspora margarita]|uniref:DEAD-like helicase n=1 Tax=Gigaspora margarita TaxID=4874 RepID=A0A8H4EI99_GIGMA|nr:DEAD-like helicase [Gigaspora margarita]